MSCCSKFTHALDQAFFLNQMDQLENEVTIAMLKIFCRVSIDASIAFGF